jgi:hypothetical protein
MQPVPPLLLLLLPLPLVPASSQSGQPPQAEERSSSRIR